MSARNLVLVLAMLIVSVSAATAQSGGARSDAAGPRPYRVSVMGGLLTGYGDAGLAVGGGVGLPAFGSQRLEIAIDGVYGHTSQNVLDLSYGTSVVAVGGSVLYNFQTADDKVRPFVGGGLVVSHSSLKFADPDFGLAAIAGTFATLQFASGLEKPLGDRRALRLEIRAGTASFGGSLLLLGGVSFR